MKKIHAIGIFNITPYVLLLPHHSTFLRVYKTSGSPEPLHAPPHSHNRSGPIAILNILRDDMGFRRIFLVPCLQYYLR